MRFIILSFLIFPLLPVNAQIGTGQWRMHITKKGLDIASNDEVVFTVMENGLIEYDISSNEVSEWSSVNSLSDISPTCIHYHKASNSFFVGYQNGNIDRIQNNTVTNIPAITLANISGSKQINTFVEYGDYIYAATAFGIVIINPAKNEIKDTYYPDNDDNNIIDIAFVSDSIIALTPQKAHIASVSNTALVDYQQWKLKKNIPINTNENYSEIEPWGNRLFVVKNYTNAASDSLFEVVPSGLENKINLTFGIEIKDIEVINNLMYTSVFAGVFVYNSSFELIEIPINYDYSVSAVTIAGNNLYASDYNFSLVEISSSGTKIIKHKGPDKNSFYSASSQKNKVAFAGGGLLSATAGSYSSAGVYLMEDENWTLIDRFNQPLWQNQLVWDALKVAIDPNDPNKIAIGSYCEYALGIVEDGKTVSSIYSFNNSLLEEANVNNNMACITDVKYDNSGNLWLINGFAKRPLKVLTKDKVWVDFNVGSSVMDQRGGEVIIDENGLKWFFVFGRGLMVYDDKGTIEDVSDDQYKQLTDAVNNGALPTNSVTAIAMDLDNELWIGTTEGFGILNNTSSIINAQPGDYEVNRIKLEFEGNVEYLLGSTYIMDIEVDGGNRKWIATASSGIVLLSSNGSEILQTFTTENSPLISNNIMDIEFNHVTGELFIITDKGLVSYRTDASMGDDDYSNVKVFPNPVYASFNGLITIQGIKYNSDVKFTDVAGNLVYQTTSNGGTAVWNGKNLQGEKVKAGTYLIWTGSNEEKGRKVGKVVIIN